ncbi:hypothetical protein [Pasteurella multocida]|uniref:hypothetical protein n=1 Tax=Pasteurella multocida TaxID=747 RepID=UPI00214DE534|nr:hypothetical protein [Pasteurella multocida]
MREIKFLFDFVVKSVGYFLIIFLIVLIPLGLLTSSFIYFDINLSWWGVIALGLLGGFIVNVAINVVKTGNNLSKQHISEKHQKMLGFLWKKITSGILDYLKP